MDEQEKLTPQEEALVREMLSNLCKADQKLVEHWRAQGYSDLKIAELFRDFG